MCFPQMIFVNNKYGNYTECYVRVLNLGNIGHFPSSQMFWFEVSKELGAEQNSIFQLNAANLKANPFHSRVFQLNQNNTINFHQRKWTQVGMAKWNRIFCLFHFYGTCQENLAGVYKRFCFIRFLTSTHLAQNFRKFRSNAKRPQCMFDCSFSNHHRHYR